MKRSYRPPVRYVTNDKWRRRRRRCTRQKEGKRRICTSGAKWRREGLLRSQAQVIVYAESRAPVLPEPDDTIAPGRGMRIKRAARYVIPSRGLSCAASGTAATVKMSYARSRHAPALESAGDLRCGGKRENQKETGKKKNADSAILHRRRANACRFQFG